MTARTTHHCNECGKPITTAQAALYAGLHMGATAVAHGGEIDWHSCGAACAAAYLRAVAMSIEAHAAMHAAEQKKVDDNRAAFAKATQPGASPVRGEVPDSGTRVPR